MLYSMDRDTSPNRDAVKSRMYESQRRLESMEELIEKLIECSDGGDIIVVEGKRDIVSLRRLGVRGQMEEATHRPLLDLSEELSCTCKRIIVLTDWDHRGGILAQKLSDNLRYFGTDIDTDIRERISSLVKKEVKDVESLHTYVSKLRILVAHRH